MSLDEFLAKLEFWYVRKFFKLDKQFTFMHDVSKPNALSVRFVGKFEGVIVEYDNVKISDDGQLHFDFNIIANPNLKNTGTASFLRFTKNVMRSIIINSIELAEKEQNEDRKFDLDEFDDERDLHEEGPAVSEERVPKRKPRKKAVRRNKAIHSKV